ncbi:MAG TPA: hypothetical protein V6D08_15675 [Candidatus Obscuribacterales bacterium]
MNYRYNQESLDRHGVSRSDVDEVLAVTNVTTRGFDMELADEGNLRIMFVGYNFAGRLLEVGVEFMSEIEVRVFHAQAVSPKYCQLYKERISNE